MMRFGKLLRDTCGAMAVETAISLPFVLLLGLGGFQVSSAIARHAELQAAAAEGEQIVLATKPKTTTELDTIKSILMTSTGLATEDIRVSFRYRCGTSSDVQLYSGACDNNTQEWAYVRIRLRDTYVPLWTQLGLGSDVDYWVVRTAQVS